MRKFIIGLAGIAALSAAPASAAVSVFSEGFENGFGGFTANGNVAVATGQAYKNVGFDGSNAASLQNSMASFGGSNRAIGGSILASTIAGFSTATLYTINFDAAYIGRSAMGIAGQYLLFSATDQFNNSVEATLVPVGSPEAGTAGSDVLVGGDNLDTLFSRRYQYQFTGTGPISLSFSGGGAFGDNADVLLDNVLVRSGAVPETSTWAMMILGLGSVGGMMRRARRPARKGALANA